jgi:hypothetical protein
MSRLFANLILILAIVTLPWWFAAALIILWCVLFDFFEAAVYGLVLDILYAVPDGFFYSHIFLILATILYLISVVIRPNLRSV